MLFQASITIPANTTEAAPTTQALTIARGIITEFKVRPRPGHAALAHLVILHGSHQIAPSTPDMSIAGDAFPVDWADYYEFYEPPYQLVLKGWNDDDTYPHTFDVYAAILPRKAILALAVVDAIRGALGSLSPKRIFTGGK